MYVAHDNQIWLLGHKIWMATSPLDNQFVPIHTNLYHFVHLLIPEFPCSGSASDIQHDPRRDAGIDRGAQRPRVRHAHHRAVR
jgi:hypothetical protein